MNQRVNLATLDTMLLQLIRFTLPVGQTIAKSDFSVLRSAIAKQGALQQYFGYSIPTQTAPLPKERHEITWVISALLSHCLCSVNQPANQKQTGPVRRSCQQALKVWRMGLKSSRPRARPLLYFYPSRRSNGEIMRLRFNRHCVNL